MISIYVLALLLGASQLATPSSADSDELFRGGWGRDLDDSDEYFGRSHRPSLHTTTHSRWRSSSSPVTTSWRRHDSSDESDERWGGNQWAKPVTTYRRTTSSSGLGQPLNTWSSNSVWDNRQTPTSNPWAWTNQQNKWSNSWSSNKWQDTGNKWNKWNSGKSSFSNSGKWRDNNSWNRRRW